MHTRNSAEHMLHNPSMEATFIACKNKLKIESFKKISKSPLLHSPTARNPRNRTQPRFLLRNIRKSLWRKNEGKPSGTKKDKHVFHVHSHTYLQSTVEKLLQDARKNYPEGRIQHTKIKSLLALVRRKSSLHSRRHSVAGPASNVRITRQKENSQMSETGHRRRRKAKDTGMAKQTETS